MAGRETTNFTYPIRNESELRIFLAESLARPRADVDRVLDELARDRELHDWLDEGLRAREDPRARAYLGRRIGWYAAARLLAPQVVVETGTHNGLGTAVLARALQRNAEEGRPGRLFTFDVDPGSGWLVPEPLRAYVEQTTGDIKTTLPAASRGPLRGRVVGLFLHDSDHSYEHETFELETIRKHLTSSFVVMSDNSHSNRALQDFAERQGWTFAFWKERPKGHPYPGSGIGLARLVGEGSGRL